MERFITELTTLAIKSAERGDVSGAKQITELVVMARQSQVERVNALLSIVELLDRLTAQEFGLDQAPEQGV